MASTVKNGIACLRKGNRRRHQQSQAITGNSSQASDRRIFNTVNTLMRTCTEFITEISAPTISTSFKYHLLHFLVKAGRGGGGCFEKRKGEDGKATLGLN